jgi:glycosyltransferase involved in cell wall biosynthesis
MIHTPFLARAGGERQILRLAIELQKKGNEVEIFTNSVNWDTYPEFFNQVKITVVPFPLIEKLPSKLIPQMWKTRIQENLDPRIRRMSKYSKLLDRARQRMLSQYYISLLPPMIELARKIPKRFDIVNNHNFPTEWAAFAAKARLKVPTIWMCNEPPHWFLYPEIRTGLANISWPLFEILDKRSVNYIDDIMVLSHVAEGYVSRVYGRSSRVVRTGVDVDFFHSASGDNLRSKFNLEGSFVMLSVGGSKYINRQAAVRTLAILSKSYHNVKLIIDTPREAEALKLLSEKLHVGNQVMLLNSRSDSELAEVYAASDVFLYPASVGTWGLVVTEAMAAAKPVIVPKEVGAAEIIQNNENGIIINNATPNEMAKQVEKLIEDVKLRKNIGEKAYQYAKNYLSWEKYANTVEGIFKETLKRSKMS